MSKAEIEKFLKGKGDFVQIDYLARLLNEKEIPLDKKKFVYKKLADLYEKKGMFREVAKMYGKMAEASIAFSEKNKNHVKEAEFCILAGNFDAADEAIKKSMVEANVSERAEIFIGIKQFYKEQAKECEKKMKRSHAVKIYEKLLRMNLNKEEKQEIKKELVILYEKLGRLKEYFSMKKNK